MPFFQSAFAVVAPNLRENDAKSSHFEESDDEMRTMYGSFGGDAVDRLYFKQC